MALTLTIAGTDFLPQYVTGSAKIRARLNSDADELRLTLTKKSGQNTPEEGQEIVFKDGARFLFAGHISRIDPSETGEGQLITYRIEATDYTYILINKNAQISYENQTLAYIVDDLLTQYVAAGYGFTHVNTETGPTINTISFNHISLRKAFEKLSQVTGYEWYVDYEKDVHFFAKTSKPAPEDFTDSTANFEEVDMSVDTSQVRNSIVVRGGREESSSYMEQDFKGDGEAREWILREKPKTMVDILLDTGGGFVSQAYGVDVLNDDTGNDFMFNYQEKFIRATATTTTPNTSTTLRAQFYYEVPVLVKVTSSTSIAAMAALEGGDGKHEYVITRPDVKSKAEARRLAAEQIAEWGNPLLTGRVRTRTGLLQAGSYFAPGQALTVNMPTWGISTDTDYLIQEVETTLTEDGSTVEYHYEITFGGRLIGIREFLEGLAGEEKVILDTEEIDRIEGFEEIVTVSDSISRNSGLRSVTETVTVAESQSATNTTPPFKWNFGESIWLPFSEGSGLGAADKSGNNLPAVLDAGAAWVTKADGFSELDCDGTDIEFATVASSPNLLETTDFTIMATVRADASTSNQFFVCHYNWRFLVTSGKMQFSTGRMNNAAGPTYSATALANFTLGQHYILTGVYDTVNQRIRLYIDGVLQQTTSIGTDIIWPDYGNFNLIFGNSKHGSAIGLNGGVADFRGWQRVLTDLEIAYAVANTRKVLQGYGRWGAFEWG